MKYRCRPTACGAWLGSRPDACGGRPQNDADCIGTDKTLTTSFLSGRNLTRAERIGEPRFRRTGLERLLLIRMRRPARQPDDLEGRAHPAVIVGKALGVNFGHALQGRALERRAAAGQ